MKNQTNKKAATTTTTVNNVINNVKVAEKASKKVEKAQTKQEIDANTLKGARMINRSVVELTTTFNQALKVFSGLRNVTMEKLNCTVGEHFANLGVNWVDGKPLTVTQLRSAIAPIFKGEKGLQMYTNVACTTLTFDNEEPKTVNVYALNKDKWAACRVRKMVAIDKWNANVILELLTQSAFEADATSEAQASVKKWNDTEKVYTRAKKAQRVRTEELYLYTECKKEECAF